MKTITINLYQYAELPKESKEQVREWFLNNPNRTALFSEWVKEELKSIYPNSSLDIQYSFSHSQGDGLNVYGTLSLIDFLNVRASDFSRFEMRLLKIYLSHTEHTLKLDYNYRYNYSLAPRIVFANNLINDLTFHKSHPDVDAELLYKLERLVREWFISFCENAEEDGYNFFYKANEDEVVEYCKENNCHFTLDGKFNGYVYE